MKKTHYYKIILRALFPALSLGAVLCLSSCKDDEGDTDSLAGLIRVSFVCDGYPIFVDAYVESGDKISEPAPAPKKPGYSVEGWYTDENLTARYDFEKPVISTLVLYAGWIQNHIVTFDMDGGDPMDPVEVYPGGTLTPPEGTFTRGEEIFDGWYLGDEEFDFETPITSDITLTAHWTTLMFTVTFDSMGGSEVDPVEVSVGKYAPAPARPTKDDLILFKWYSDFELTEEFVFGNIPIYADMTLYARYFKAPVDYNGIEYKVVEIGSQIWTAENIRSTKLNDGTAITVSGTWSGVASPVCWYYGGVEANIAVHGMLYNRAAAINPKICPLGYRLPVTADIIAINAAVGADPGYKLKAAGANSTWPTNPLNTDSYGFTMLAGGFGSGNGSYGMGENANIWYNNGGSMSDWAFNFGNGSNLNPGLGDNGAFAFYIRCIKE